MHLQLNRRFNCPLTWTLDGCSALAHVNQLPLPRLYIGISGHTPHAALNLVFQPLPLLQAVLTRWVNLPMLSTPTYSARTIFSQCHAAPQITVIWLELWRYTNYITYLLTRTYLHLGISVPIIRLSLSSLHSSATDVHVLSGWRG